MGKPRLIIIIRHAQSEGNRDKAIHQTTPDHRVGLTPEGHQQAREAGEKLRQLLRNDDTLHFFISPYRRTRETTEGILSTLTANDPVPSPFQRSHIKVYEEPRLREQDFGNFQPGTEETERLWKERAQYGHFFYRIPNGESGADVYDRVSSFNGSLWRRFSEDRMANVAILVTHGLCSRIFLMVWYHYSVEFFEDLRNVNHCEFLVMKLEKSGRYVLQNQLRRWSDLRRERASRRSLTAGSPEIPVRRWGSSRSHQELAGQLNDPQKPIRKNTVDLFEEGAEEKTSGKDSSKPSPRDLDPQAESHRRESPQLPDETRPEFDQLPVLQLPKSVSNLSSRLREVAISDDLPSPKGTNANESLVWPGRFGRDGGGSRSGFGSPDQVSDQEEGEIQDDESIDPLDIRMPQSQKKSGQFKPSSLAAALKGELEGHEKVMADALGDQSDAEVDELDLEVGTKERVRREEAQILANERLDRMKRSVNTE